MAGVVVFVDDCVPAPSCDQEARSLMSIGAEDSRGRRVSGDGVEWLPSAQGLSQELRVVSSFPVPTSKVARRANLCPTTTGANDGDPVGTSGGVSARVPAGDERNKALSARPRA